MEWKKVRRWLILMLVAVDLLLAGNLVRQVADSRRSERQALMDAVRVAAGREIVLDSEALLRLPDDPVSYTGTRDPALEQAAADALLGSGILPEGPGGGVSIYRGAAGQLSFRRGGLLELDLLRPEGMPTEEGWAELLEPAGFGVKEALWAREGAAVIFTQRYEETVIINSRLTAELQDGTLVLRGRWLLSGELTGSGVGMSRAQLVLALCELLESRGSGAPDRLEFGYYLQSEDAHSLTLVPVWLVSCGAEQIALSCLSGQAILF